MVVEAEVELDPLRDSVGEEHQTERRRDAEPSHADGALMASGRACARCIVPLDA